MAVGPLALEVSTPPTITAEAAVAHPTFGLAPSASTMGWWCPVAAAVAASATATPQPAPTLVPTPTAAPAGFVLLPANQPLRVNDQLRSSNGKTRLLMQADGNLVLYRTDNGVPLWASNTWGKAMTFTLMQND